MCIQIIFWSHQKRKHRVADGFCYRRPTRIDAATAIKKKEKLTAAIKRKRKTLCHSEHKRWSKYDEGSLELLRARIEDVPDGGFFGSVYFGLRFLLFR
jgi:hypothetical protein